MKSITFFVLAASFALVATVNAETPATISLPQGCVVLAQTGQLSCPVPATVVAPVASATSQPCCETAPTASSAAPGCCPAPLDERMTAVTKDLKKIRVAESEMRKELGYSNNPGSASSTFGDMDPWMMAALGVLALAFVVNLIYLLTRNRQETPPVVPPPAPPAPPAPVVPPAPPNQMTVPVIVQLNAPPPIDIDLAANLRNPAPAVPPPAAPARGRAR